MQGSGENYMSEKNYNTKEALVEKVKELAESDNVSYAIFQLRNLKRQWRRLGGDEESLYDKEMADEFYKYADLISSREEEAQASVEDTKKNIIERAKEVLNETNFKKATAAMNQLMDEWKASGRSGKEADDELWAQFKEARDEFFAKRTAYYDNLTETFKANREIKEKLIERAKEIVQIENIKEMTSAMDTLMADWKAAGTAGRAADDSLWEKFNVERKAVYAKRNAYYDNLKEMYAQRVQAKQAIIAEAKQYLARSEFTDEEVAAVKELRAKWKEVGNAGKDNEDNLWNEFNGLLNKYFENMRYYKD